VGVAQGSVPPGVHGSLEEPAAEAAVDDGVSSPLGASALLAAGKSPEWK